MFHMNKLMFFYPFHFNLLTNKLTLCYSVDGICTLANVVIVNPTLANFVSCFASFDGD
jgi:hypothetical protein